MVKVMIIANHKPIAIIGYQESSMTQEFVNEISKTHEYTIIGTKDFFDQPDNRYQYIVSVSWDREERKRVVDQIDTLGFDLITVIQDYTLLGIHPKPVIHPGTFIFGFCDIAIGSTIGRHCIIGRHTLIGHHVVVGNNCITRPSVIVNDKSQVGNNCIFNTRATVTNKTVVCDDVELLAFSAFTKNIDQPGRYAGIPARKIA
jgi:UDP-3-O-[3-hydroxymyristoyl] glucosamine N-acyltransferase